MTKITSRSKDGCYLKDKKPRVLTLCVKKREILCPALSEEECVLEKTIWRFHESLKKEIQPLCEAASPFLGTYLKNIYQRDMYSQRFNVGSSTISMKPRVYQWMGG